MNWSGDTRRIQNLSQPSPPGCSERYVAKVTADSDRLLEWIEKVLPTLERLALLEFEQSFHEQIFVKAGWEIVRESWYPNTWLEIPFRDVERGLRALYEERDREVGVGLYALTDTFEPDDYFLQSVDDYHKSFRRLLDVLRPRLSTVPSIGRYTYANHSMEYNYSKWDYGHSTLMLVQHHEGDGHLGHVATLDIRIRPTTSATFPLTTNMLF